MEPLALHGGRNEVITTFLLAIGYGILFYFINLLLASVGFGTAPNNISLNHFDAGIYLDISKNGYVFNIAKHNCGWYVLFPMIWRLLHVGVLGICIVNYLLFAIGFTILTTIYRISFLEKIIWLSLPTGYIMFIPYTEALFFLLLILFFKGLLTKNIYVIYATLILAATTRASAVFLLPALLIMQLLSNPRKDWFISFWHFLLYYGFPLLFGLGFFVWYQHHATGVWFAYFVEQRKYQGHGFSLPVLPFSSMQGYRILLPSAIAILCCLTSMVILFNKLSKWLRNGEIADNRLFIISAAYFPVALLNMAFLNPRWCTGTTLTIGIVRYVFATPFFYVFLNYFINKQYALRASTFIITLIVCNAAWLSCGSYTHFDHFIIFNFNTVIVFMYLMTKTKTNILFQGGIILVNVTFQIIMFQQYLNGLYLD